MARTTDQIRAAIEAARLADPTLAGLNSASVTAIFRAIEVAVAKAANEQENLWDAFRRDVGELAVIAESHTAPWWAERVKEFQYDTVTPYYLIWNGSAYVYNIIDPTKRIVTRVSVTEPGSGSVSIKVAKGTTPVQLAPAELTALQGYVGRRKAAGTVVNVTSLAADQLTLTIEVKYAASSTLASVQTLVEAAVNNYLANLPFDAIVRWSGIVDAIQSIGPAIVDANVLSSTINGAPFIREAPLPAGYAVIDSGTPLSGTITYIAV